MHRTYYAQLYVKWLSAKLRTMWRKRLTGGTMLVILLLVTVALMASGIRQVVVASDPDTFTGVASLSGAVQVDLRLDPPVAKPGDVVTINLTVTNPQRTNALPQFALDLPQAASLNQTNFPPGTAYNLQSNVLTWQPLLKAGATETLQVSFVTGSADLNRPIQSLITTYTIDGKIETLRADYWVGVLPHINVQGSTRASVGQPLDLIAAASGPGPLLQRWELGDGRIIRADNPVISYANAGNYQIAVEVANPLGATRVTSQVEIVPEPAAQFRFDDPTAGVGQTLIFENTSGGAAPLTYLWDFGDGNTATQRTPIHQYAEPGTYLVALTVRNALGESTMSAPVIVGTPPVADLIIEGNGISGRPINGQAFGDDSVNIYKWQMGDGHTRTGETIAHVYAAGRSILRLTDSSKRVWQHGDGTLGRH